MTTLQKIIKYCAIAFAVFLTVSIIGGICYASSVFFYASGHEDAVGEMQTHAVTGTVKSLEADLGSARFEIRTGDSFSVESNHAYLSVTNTDGLLTIKEERPAVSFCSDGVRVILTVPEGVVFDQASISTGAGEVTIDTLSAETLFLDLGAGEIRIGELTAGSRAWINSGAGELTVSGGSLANLDLDMGIGASHLNSQLTGNCGIDYGVGELDLTLTGTADDYCISFDKGVGSATLDGVKMTGGMVYGDGESFITINGGVGDMALTFSRGV